jgi:hypothetical protein
MWLNTKSAERLYASLGFVVVIRELSIDRVMMVRRPGASDVEHSTAIELPILYTSSLAVHSQG